MQKVKAKYLPTKCLRYVLKYSIWVIIAEFHQEP